MTARTIAQAVLSAPSVVPIDHLPRVDLWQGAVLLFDPARSDRQELLVSQVAGSTDAQRITIHRYSSGAPKFAVWQTPMVIPRGSHNSSMHGRISAAGNIWLWVQADGWLWKLRWTPGVWDGKASERSIKVRRIGVGNYPVPVHNPPGTKHPQVGIRVGNTVTVYREADVLRGAMIPRQVLTIRERWGTLQSCLVIGSRLFACYGQPGRQQPPLLAEFGQGTTVGRRDLSDLRGTVLRTSRIGRGMVTVRVTSTELQALVVVRGRLGVLARHNGGTRGIRSLALYEVAW